MVTGVDFQHVLLTSNSLSTLFSVCFQFFESIAHDYFRLAITFIKLRSAGYRLVYKVRQSELVISVVAVAPMGLAHGKRSRNRYR